MADKQESALTQQSDCKWVRALDSNGNSILISKEDLASVVGELIGVATDDKDGLMPKGSYRKRDQLSGDIDLNEIMDNGYYSLSILSGKTNFPDGFGGYGVLEVINPNYDMKNAFCIQILRDYGNNTFIRMKGGLGANYVWNSWVEK